VRGLAHRDAADGALAAGPADAIGRVARPQWGRGLATEIARAMIEYGFETLGLGVISASTDTPNAASVRVLEKCGFTFDRRAAVGGLETLFYEMRR
jgi:RimJ/RimL family protein N-acetyltransferase